MPNVENVMSLLCQIQTSVKMKKGNILNAFYDRSFFGKVQNQLSVRCFLRGDDKLCQIKIFTKAVFLVRPTASSYRSMKANHRLINNK